MNWFLLLKEHHLNPKIYYNLYVLIFYIQTFYKKFYFCSNLLFIIDIISSAISEFSDSFIKSMNQDDILFKS